MGQLTAFTVANTGSMEPTLTGGDLVLTAPAELREGMIIVCRIRNRPAQGRSGLVCHRIVHLNGLTIETQGDACSTSDGLLNRADVTVLGVVYAVIGTPRRVGQEASTTSTRATPAKP